MKYFVVVSSALENPDLDDAMKAELKEKHLSYIGDAYSSGKLLFNGPKVGAVGGCLVYKAESSEDANNFFNNDPHAIAKIREYSITEFSPLGCQDCLKDWLEL